MRSLLRLAALLALAIVPGRSFAGALLIPKNAPEWKVSTWLNSDPVKLSDLRGKVVLIEFFQLWCPVSSNFATPLFKRWDEIYGGRDDVAIVSIHTVFEGFDVQTPDRLREYVEEWEIHHPVGIDAHEPDDDPIPITMARYETEGTPQVAIVDKFGMLRWSHFGHFDPRPVEGFIDRLLLEKSKSESVSKSGSEPSGRSGRGSKSPSPPPSSTRGRTPPPTREPRRPAPTREEQPKLEPEDEPEDEPEIDADETDATLFSGKYRVTFEQSAKSCGDLLPPQIVFTDLRVSATEILATFSRRYLEQQEATLSYDGGSQAFSLSGQTTTQDGGVDVELQVSVSGRFLPGTAPPELEFEFQMQETGGDGSLDCTIEGRGTGGKAGS